MKVTHYKKFVLLKMWMAPQVVMSCLTYWTVFCLQRSVLSIVLSLLRNPLANVELRYSLPRVFHDVISAAIMLSSVSTCLKLPVPFISMQHLRNSLCSGRLFSRISYIIIDSDVN